MPLQDGIDTFQDNYADFEVSEAELTAFFDAQNHILAAFGDNPSLVNNPYPYGSEFVDGRYQYFIPSEMPNDNPIFASLIKAGLDKFGQNLADSTGWLQIAN